MDPVKGASGLAFISTNDKRAYFPFHLKCKFQNALANVAHFFLGYAHPSNIDRRLPTRKREEFKNSTKIVDGSGTLASAVIPVWFLLREELKIVN